MPKNPNGNPSSLTPWKPGQSGNPAGGAKFRSIVAELKKALDKKVLCGQALSNDMDAAEALGEAILYHAIKGNPAFAAFALDRIDGKVADPEPAGGDMKAVHQAMLEYTDPDADADGLDDPGAITGEDP